MTIPIFNAFSLPLTSPFPLNSKAVFAGTAKNLEIECQQLYSIKIQNYFFKKNCS